MYHAPEHGFWFGFRPPGVGPMEDLDPTLFPGLPPLGFRWYDPSIGRIRGFGFDEATGTYLGGPLDIYPRRRFIQD